MKKIFILVCFLFFSAFLFSQNEHLKHDNIWLTGYSSTPGNPSFGGTVIDFSADTLDIYYEYRDVDFEISNTTMCDAQGNLIFSCNNEVVANRLNNVMENGEDLNPDETVTQMRLRQGVLSLPSPANDSIYYIFHGQRTWVGNLDGNWTGVFNLLYSKVNMNCCDLSQLGVVTEKNVPIIQDTLDYGKITATRHANGRDWWIVLPEYRAQSYYKLLLSDEGIMVNSQAVFNLESVIGGAGQAVFSPDGTKYIRINAYSFNEATHLDIYAFDRCTGELSNPIRFYLENTQSGFGLAVSPNSRYLYVSFNGNFYQYDLNTNPIDSVLIQEYDGYTAPFATLPFMGQLGPDGKIYFNTISTNNVLHVIHNPNEAGAACNLEQHGIQLPTYNGGTIPNHPNYRLGRLIGSPCDTLDWTIDTTTVSNINPKIEELTISPNPAYDFIHFEVDEKVDYKITNYVGQIIREGETVFGTNRVDLGVLPSGVYFLTVFGERVKVGKFLVQR